jgi:hypothetical protein
MYYDDNDGFGKSMGKVAFVLLFVCSLFFLIDVACGQTVTKEGTFKIHDANVAVFNTSLATQSGRIYYAYINKDRVLTVAQKENGTWRQHRFMKVANNRYHVAPSIAVDRYGYVHLVANMHNEDWKYWVSKYPHRVDEWNRRHANSIPGEQITYPRFAVDYNQTRS